LCVGAIKICNLQSAICNLKSEINNKESVIRNISIPVPASDGSGMAGFTEGHPILMKVWKADTNREYLAEAEILKGTATFVKHESSLVSLKNLRIRRLGDLATWRETDMNGIRIFPNPTAGKIYFTTGSHSTGELIIQVFNAPGQAVMNKVIKAGPGMIDLSGHAPGIYYISITLDSYTKTEKVMLR